MEINVNDPLGRALHDAIKKALEKKRKETALTAPRANPGAGTDMGSQGGSGVYTGGLGTGV